MLVKVRCIVRNAFLGLEEGDIFYMDPDSEWNDEEVTRVDIYRTPHKEFGHILINMNKNHFEKV